MLRPAMLQLIVFLDSGDENKAAEIHSITNILRVKGFSPKRSKTFDANMLGSKLQLTGVTCKE